MKTKDIKQILHFIRKAEQLKNRTRSGHTSTGRKESVAEHTWRLCLMALAFEQHFPGIDISRVIKICIVHDLGEAIGGDIPAPNQTNSEEKATTERCDLLQLLEDTPKLLEEEVLGLWDEYEEISTEEAKIAKALDKLETILQHNQGKNSLDFDYAFNLDYGKEYSNVHPVISEIRKILDGETKKLADS